MQFSFSGLLEQILLQHTVVVVWGRFTSIPTCSFFAFFAYPHLRRRIEEDSRRRHKRTGEEEERKRKKEDGIFSDSALNAKKLFSPNLALPR